MSDAIAELPDVVRQARLALEGPIDYDAVKAIANRSLSIVDDLTGMVSAVLALHFPSTFLAGRCDHDGNAWPCATARVLEGAS